MKSPSTATAKMAIRFFHPLRVEWLGWAILLVAINASLFTGSHHTIMGFVFHPSALFNNEWWRVITYPFAHASLYHLLLDGCAFLSLYALLDGSLVSRIRVFAYGAIAGAPAALSVPALYTHGLCGLSGPAHGLWAYVTLTLSTQPPAPLHRMRAEHWLWRFCFLLGAVKCAVEALTGSVVFESWHLADIGLPIAVCHAGGFLGGIAAWLMQRRDPLSDTGTTHPRA